MTRNKRTAYRRGQRLLKQRRESRYIPIKFSMEPDTTQIAKELAKEYGVTLKAMRDAAKFAQAVDRVVRNCGDFAFELLITGSLTRKEIKCISWKAPTRQEKEIHEIQAGRRPLKKPKRGVAALDTETFFEVISRVDRVRRLVFSCVRSLQRHENEVLTSTRKERYAERLDRVWTAAKDLQVHTNAYGVKPGYYYYPTRVRRRNRSREPSLKEAFGRVASAHGLIVKNCRDLPRLPKSTKPTPEDVAAINYNLDEIEQASRKAQRLLARCSEIPV